MAQNGKRLVDAPDISLLGRLYRAAYNDGLVRAAFVGDDAVKLLDEIDRILSAAVAVSAHTYSATDISSLEALRNLQDALEPR